jgi:hypothetical protein
MTIYVIASAIIYTLMNYCNSNLAFALSLGINTLLIVAFMALIVKMDMPLNSLPIIGKKFKK